MIIKTIQQLAFQCVCLGLIAFFSLFVSIPNVMAAPTVQPLAAMEEMADEATEQMEETAEDTKQAVEEGMERPSEKAQEAQQELNNQEAEAEEDDGGGIVNKLKSFFTGQ